MLQIYDASKFNYNLDGADFEGAFGADFRLKRYALVGELHSIAIDLDDASADCILWLTLKDFMSEYEGLNAHNPFDVVITDQAKEVSRYLEALR